MGTEEALNTMSEYIRFDGTVIKLQENLYRPYDFNLPVPTGTIARWQSDTEFATQQARRLMSHVQTRILETGLTYKCVGCGKKAVTFTFNPTVSKLPLPEVHSFPTLPTCGDKRCLVKSDHESQVILKEIMGERKFDKLSLRCCNGCQATESKRGQFRACSKCTVTVYCSKTCQVQDWTKGGHKKACRRVPEGL